MLKFDLIEQRFYYQGRGFNLGRKILFLLPKLLKSIQYIFCVTCKTYRVIYSCKCAYIMKNIIWCIQTCLLAYCEHQWLSTPRLLYTYLNVRQKCNTIFGDTLSAPLKYIATFSETSNFKMFYPPGCLKKYMNSMDIDIMFWSIQIDKKLLASKKQCTVTFICNESNTALVGLNDGSLRARA